MKKIILLLPIFFLFLFVNSFLLVSKVSAADVRTGQNIFISSGEQNLHDLYLFGQSIRVGAPVTNDIVAAGQDITFDDIVTGDLIGVGGNISIRGNIGNTVRVAGGNINIESSIAKDLVAAGGTINLTKTATVSGDLMVAGGQITIDAPVKGKALINGGDVTINNEIGGDINGGTIGKLTLGPQAMINGNLTYSSSEKANIDPGAVIKGKINYHYIEPQNKTNEGTQNLITFGAFYKLLIDILLSILFILFFARFILATLTRMTTTPLKSGAIGFTYLILFPLISLILLILVWLGVASFLFYALSMLISIFIVKVFIGWIIMRWYEKNQKQDYVLNWKAGVVGPIVLFILLLIPVLGWLIAAFIFFVSVGALLEELITSLGNQKLELNSEKKK